MVDRRCYYLPFLCWFYHCCNDCSRKTQMIWDSPKAHSFDAMKALLKDPSNFSNLCNFVGILKDAFCSVSTKFLAGCLKQSAVNVLLTFNWTVPSWLIRGKQLYNEFYLILSSSLHWETILCWYQIWFMNWTVGCHAVHSRVALTNPAIFL